MKLQINQYFKVLDLSPDATLEEVRVAYRDLASVWHPDKYRSNPRLANKANQKLKEINIAYNEIRRHLATQNGQSQRAAPSERVFCQDENCGGMIGQDGTCTLCKKPFTPKANTDKSHGVSKKPEYDFPPFKSRYPFGIKWILGASLLIFLFYFSNDVFKQNKNNPKSYPSKQIETVRKPTNQGTENTKGRRYRLIPVGTTIKESIDDRLRKNYSFFKNYPAFNDRKTAIFIQERLNRIGYNTGPIDGIYGEKTIKALSRYCVDLNLAPTTLTANEIIVSIKKNCRIIELHPDWLKIKDSPQLSSWMVRQSILPFDEMQKLFKAGEPARIARAVTFFKFDVSSPQIKSLPRTGFLEKRYKEGLGPLKIVTKPGQRHYLLKISYANTHKTLAVIFIRGGETFFSKVSLGDYILSYASGIDWYGSMYLFGPQTSYKKAEKVFRFKNKGDYYSGYEVELITQQGGNLFTKEISPFDF